MKTINQEVKVIDLDDACQSAIRGGNFSIWTAVSQAVVSLINNFGDLREGFADGFGGKPVRYDFN